MDLNGVYVPLITPFAHDGSVAHDELRGLAHRYVEAGASGLIALGTTGEPATLDATERRQVVETVAGVCRGSGASFAVGAGTNSTQAVLDMVHELEDVEGLDAVLSVVPYYTRPSEAGIVEHFGQVARRSPAPLIVYNIPYRTGRGLGAASLLELARMDNVCGLKQAVGGIDADTLELMADKPASFQVMCGDDPFIYSLMCLGGSGAIAASSHVCTESFVAMVDAARKGDHEHALRVANALGPVCKLLFAEPSPSVLKGVLHAQGHISTSSLRLPMTSASSSAVRAAADAVDDAQRALA